MAKISELRWWLPATTFWKRTWVVDPLVEVTSAPDAEDLAFLREALADFNDMDAGPAGRLLLMATARNEQGKKLAALSGYTAWGWLYVQWLWVDGPSRRQGLAGRMLTSAEVEARRRGCHSAWIDTFNPVALRAYERQGYEPFGVLEDFPMGRKRTFLQKRL